MALVRVRETSVTGHGRLEVCTGWTFPGGHAVARLERANGVAALPRPLRRTEQRKEMEVDVLTATCTQIL